MTAETTTDAEAKAIRTLKRLAKNWPSTLWLFASGDLHVMRTGKDGERVMVTQERALEGGHMHPIRVIRFVKEIERLRMALWRCQNGESA